MVVELPAPAASIKRQRAIVRDAVLREPVNAEGLSILAALADARGESRQARTLFRLSEVMSRRNRLAQFWLIEDSVNRGDIKEALRHYDRAMRVSGDAATILMPILVGASSDASVLSALLPTLAQRPLWLTGYLNQLATSGTDPAVISAVLRVAPPDIRNDRGRYLAENLLRRMIALKAGGAAVVAANRLQGRPGKTRSLQGGNFEVADDILPFAWWLKDETSMRAYRDDVPNGGSGLRIETGAGSSGPVAQQFVGLGPGRYTLQGSAGNVSQDTSTRPAIDIACDNGSSLAHFVLPASPENGGRFRFVFDVPANCAVQSVLISTAPAVDTNIWLDDLSIVPIIAIQSRA